MSSISSSSGSSVSKVSTDTSSQEDSSEKLGLLLTFGLVPLIAIGATRLYDSYW